MIYNMFLILILIFSIIGEFKIGNRKILNIFTIATFFMLFIFSAFRYNVGTDYKNYIQLYEMFKQNPYSLSHIEIGYNILTYITTIFFNDYKGIFIITSFIINFFIYKGIRNNSVNVPISLFLYISLYFYCISFNLIRQFISISLIFYSISFLKKQQIKKYYLLVLIAISFHMTAIVGLFIPRLKDIILKGKQYVFLAFITLAMAIFFNNIFQYIIIFFPKYNFYSNYTKGRIGGTFFIIVCILIISFVYKKSLLKQNYLNNFYINMIFISVLLEGLSAINIMFSRMSSYFYIFSILLIPEILKLFDKRLRVTLYLILIILSIMWFNYLLLNNNAGVMPYQYQI